jgi:uracil-DNA glycosylase family 4
MDNSIEKQIQELRDKAKLCQDCKELVATRTQVVFGSGNPKSKLVFAGEAPGETEDARGLPFIGRAGKLLDEVLKENSMSREEIWITNIVKCRPTKTSPAGGLENRAPLAGEIKACQKWLSPELSLIKPTVIVCLGGPSSSVIIHKGFKMIEERGQWFTDSLYAPFVIAALHPAYVLRLKGDSFDRARELLVADIAEAKKKSLEAKDQPRMTLF